MNANALMAVGPHRSFLTRWVSEFPKLSDRTAANCLLHLCGPWRILWVHVPDGVGTCELHVDEWKKVWISCISLLVFSRWAIPKWYVQRIAPVSDFTGAMEDVLLRY